MEFRNDLMRFYEICSSYAYSEVNDYRRDQSMVEVTTFYSGPEALAVTKRVNSRLNISENENSFTTEEVRIMWVLCGFEKALLGPGYDSPWCHLLTTEDSQVLEYAQDLKAYWKKGYGYTINYEQSCPLLTDIFTNFQEIISNSSAPAVSLYFGHTETLLPFYSLLGLFLDEKPLTASNFLQHKEKRKFRSSIISPFAANIGFTLYECEEGAQASHPDWPQDLQSHMLQIMVNEQIMPLPFTDKVAVSISDFEYHYYQYVHYCNFNKLCNNHQPMTTRLMKNCSWENYC
ncbi:MINPP1 [Bugula neritina]|uniref:Multiple inositol polyphosphate phosphatase 1 n=1 Tax=Bugula neritina TaxID=10212 RepID=A0A7J7JIL1_BUGNE|nr:MINPP1 [Bugula neritina]